MKPPPRIDPKKMLRWVLQGAALAGVATVAVFLFTVRPETWTHLREFNPWWIPLLMGLVFIAWACNGARVWIFCRALGHPLSYRTALQASMSQEFGVAATPAGIGGAVIRLTLLKRAGVPVAHGGSMLASDAALDVLFFALLAPFALWVMLHDALFAKLLARMDGRALLPLLGGGAAGVVAIVVLLRSVWFHRLVGRLAGATRFGRKRRLPARHRFLRQATARTLRRMRAALALLWGRRKSALLLNFLLGSVQWTCRYSLLPLILWAMHTPVNPVPLFLAQGLLFMLSMAVVVPGGGGAVEVLAALILPAFVPVALVGAVLVLWRLLTFNLYLLGGGTAFFLAVRAKRLTSESE
ncbi:MAG TPA: lysylphosphatidylglycerol synthase transmembrane domain-containing protein [Opitutaceae bacterium]|nr:lysylphosphatidylglycerol synthase transmembrane domain-containing protein [Opitutaceae bacterium]